MADQLPPLPLSMDDFEGWRNYLAAVGNRVSLLSIDATPPALVTNVTLTQVYPGILVSWNRTLKADSYILYRNTIGTFATASPIIQLTGNGNVSFFDITQSLSQTATIYYWVRGVNALGTQGPVSAMASTANSLPVGPGIMPGSLQTALMILAIPDDDLPQDFGTGFLTTSDTVDVTGDVRFWCSAYEDEDFMTTDSMQLVGRRYQLP